MPYQTQQQSQQFIPRGPLKQQQSQSYLYDTAEGAQFQPRNRVKSHYQHAQIKSYPNMAAKPYHQYSGSKQQQQHHRRSSPISDYNQYYYSGSTANSEEEYFYQSKKNINIVSSNNHNSNNNNKQFSWYEERMEDVPQKLLQGGYLDGIKIMMNGKVIHNEQHCDYDLFGNSSSGFNSSAEENSKPQISEKDMKATKFASSTYKQAPNAQSISLPSFL